MTTKESILKFFKEEIKHPLSFRDICFQLNLSSSERRRLKRLMRELISEGSVVRTRKGLYGPADEMNLITGYFEAHRDGYGFLIPEKPGQRDIFIPARATLGAMDNDRVVARIEDIRRREGKIIRILQRAHSRIVGTLEFNRKVGFYVRPKNKAILFDLHIAPKEIGRAKDGNSVIAEIISYATDKRPPVGRIVKVLERPNEPKDEVESIIDEFNLPRRFPHNVIEEAKGLIPPSLKEGDVGLRKRKDLRNLLTVTIDGERAKDFDDAISIKKTDEGYKLWVHIADVGFYVQWDSLIDVEARKRATSIYFPDRVIPMLPKELSEDICSLRPGLDRYTFTVEMDFDSNGDRINQRFYQGIINSNERMTYTAVKKILIDRDQKERKRYDYLLRDFELMAELCNILKSRRIKRGSLDFDLPEPEVLLDIQGNPEAIIKAERNFAHMMIEEFMIAANEAVAEHLESLNVPSLYRIHEQPDTAKLEDIVRVIKSLGILKNYKGIKAPDFANLLKQIRGTTHEDIINHMILRSMKQARYSHINIGHFGLASKCYAHFTSPIRRYPDLIVHRILKEIIEKGHLSDKRIKELESLLPNISFHSSRMERQADEAERAVIDAMRMWFMKDKVGEEFEGKVISVAPYGLKIRLKDYYVEGFIHVSYMTDDFYKYDEKGIALYGIHKKKRFSIGSELKVRVEKVDMEEREIILS